MFIISDLFRSIAISSSLLLIIALILAVIVGPLILVVYFVHKASKGKDIFMAWTFMTLILLILKLAYGIISAIIEVVTYIITKERIKNASQKKDNPYQPGQGTDADYERWKQKHQNQGENT